MHCFFARTLSVYLILSLLLLLFNILVVLSEEANVFYRTNCQCFHFSSLTTPCRDVKAVIPSNEDVCSIPSYSRRQHQPSSHCLHCAKWPSDNFATNWLRSDGAKWSPSGVGGDQSRAARNMNPNEYPCCCVSAGCVNTFLPHPLNQFIGWLYVSAVFTACFLNGQ